MNKRNFFRRTLIVAAMGSLGIIGSTVQAEIYPAKPINLVVGYPPGGSVDLTARVVGEALSHELKQSIVVENLGGAGGTIGAQKVARSAPDGYTLLLGSANEMVIAGLINPTVAYDGQKDFTPIGVIAAQPLLLTASKELGVNSAADYLKALKAGKPNQFTYGSSGVGTSLHLAGEMINQSTGTKAEHVPYRGVTPLLTDLVNGQLNYGVFVLSSGLPHVTSGRVVALGTTEKKRSPSSPNIPALSETPGFEDVDINVWFALFAPANLPQDKVSVLRAALHAAMRSDTLRKKLEASGASLYEPGVDAAAFQKEQTGKYLQLVRLAGLERK